VANTNLRLVGLDFDAIKSNLKNYLKRSDSPFKDIDFEGSNISALLDVLAYNTYMNSFYLNMTASEMFLDSAVLRDSIVSHAKELNYVPRSYRSSQAVISFNITPSSPLNGLLVPKGTSFTTKLGSNNYTFSTDTNFVLTPDANGNFSANNITIYEGRYVTDTFLFTSENPEERFVLSNPTIDTRSISVIVLENDGANSYSYTRATSFLDQQANSQIFFLQAAENEQYEILFGDNVIGRRPQNGAAIIVEYRVCNGELPNGSSVFFIDGPIQGQANISTIGTTTPARGGAINETLQSIKFSAPRAYQNQDRAITTTDYENILKANFGEIQSVYAYGGEDVSPPQYGQIFVAVDLFGADGVPEADKRRYNEFLARRSPIGLSPVVVDPVFLYVGIEMTIRYNTNVTNLTPDAMRAIVANAISAYNQDSLENFGRTLRCVKLAESVTASDPSILGLDLLVHPYKILNVVLATRYSAFVDFGFKLSKFVNIANESDEYIKTAVKAIYSSRFTYNDKNCIIHDDGNGKLNIYEIGETTTLFLNEVGTVDYDTGLAQINNLIVTNFDGSRLKLYANPEVKDIPATKNSIIRIDDSDVDITVVAIAE